MRWAANSAPVPNSMVPGPICKTAHQKHVLLKKKSLCLTCKNVFTTSRIYQHVPTHFSHKHTDCKYNNYIQTQYSNTPNYIFLHIQLIHIHPGIANYTPHMSNYVKYAQTYPNIFQYILNYFQKHPIIAIYIPTYPNIPKCTSIIHIHFKYTQMPK